MRPGNLAQELRQSLEATIHQLSGKGPASEVLSTLELPQNEGEVLNELYVFLMQYAITSGRRRLLLVPGRGGVLLKSLTEEDEETLQMSDELIARLSAALTKKAQASAGVGHTASRFEGRDYDVFARSILSGADRRLSVYLVDPI